MLALWPSITMKVAQNWTEHLQNLSKQILLHTYVTRELFLWWLWSFQVLMKTNHPMLQCEPEGPQTEFSPSPVTSILYLNGHLLGTKSEAFYIQNMCSTTVQWPFWSNIAICREIPWEHFSNVAKTLFASLKFLGLLIQLRTPKLALKLFR